MENGVAPLAKLRPGIGAVDVDDDIGRIEQNDQVLREIGQRIYLQVPSVSSTDPVSATPQQARTTA